MVGRGEKEGIQDGGARSGWCARRGVLVSRTMNSDESGNGRDGGLNFLSRVIRRVAVNSLIVWFD